MADEAQFTEKYSEVGTSVNMHDTLLHTGHIRTF